MSWIAYRGVIGAKHHLYGGAVHLLAKNMVSQGRLVEAEPLLYEALDVKKSTPVPKKKKTKKRARSPRWMTY